jgi:hypothetical protein
MTAEPATAAATCLELAARLRHDGADRIGDTVNVVDSLFNHSILRERAHGVAFYAVLVSRSG